MSRQEKINDAVKSAGLMMLLCLVISLASVKLAISIGVVIMLIGAMWDVEWRKGKICVDWYSAIGDTIGIAGGIILSWWCDECVGIF